MKQSAKRTIAYAVVGGVPTAVVREQTGGQVKWMHHSLAGERTAHPRRYGAMNAWCLDAGHEADLHDVRGAYARYTLQEWRRRHPLDHADLGPDQLVLLNRLRVDAPRLFLLVNGDATADWAHTRDALNELSALLEVKL